jgi:uncharacterized membrane protein YcaP (DUF421 family)
MEKLFFDNWESIARTICLTTLGYFAMVVLLRASGKRTLSKMNAFDFIVTIAMGSSLATLSLNKDVSLADGVTAFFSLIFLQYVLTWLSVRVKKIKSVITSSPTLIFYNGEFLFDEMKKQRITIEEIYNASRQKDFSKLDNVDVIILEATGDITIIQNSGEGKIDTLTDVKSTQLKANTNLPVKEQ